MSTVTDILNIARRYIGYSEANGKHKEILKIYNAHKPLARGYTIKSTDSWCDAFVSAVAIQAGAVDIIGTEVGVEKHVAIFKKKGIWIENGSIAPMAGDIIVFNWDDKTQPNDGQADHIGFVEKCDGKTITCIEGNYKDSVGRRVIKVGYGYIRGFARPKYSKEVSKAKTLDQIALEVIDGKWGAGAVRKVKLTESGYDYSVVQKRVNEILSGRNSKTVEEIAREVIDGKWGNGEARKKAIIAAGYDYETVQNKVNKLL